MAIDWEMRPKVWRLLTTENVLFQILPDTVKARTIDQVKELLDIWKIFDNSVDGLSDEDWPTPDQGRITRAMFKCALIAAILKDVADSHLLDLLHQLDSNAVIPQELLAVSPESGTWRQRLWEWLNQLTWPPFLGVAKNQDVSTAWAWDTTAAMMGHPRKVATKNGERCTENIIVLLVQSKNGIIAKLELEQLADAGQGVLYPDPATMSFVYRDLEFRQAENNARAYVRSEGLWSDQATFDVRWRLIRQDNRSLPEVKGSSAGGAFALGLAKLLSKP
jgi:hypothetical protein